MKRIATALVLSTLCSAVSACGDKQRIVEVLPTPPARLVCEAAGPRPTIPPEYVVNWNPVAAAPTVRIAVERAQAEVGKLIATVRTREGIVAAHYVRIEGRLFVCSNNMQWRRDYEANLPTATVR
jgi:hypothetical protein